MLKPGFKYGSGKFISQVGSGRSAVEARRQAIGGIERRIAEQVREAAYERVLREAYSSAAETSAKRVELMVSEAAVVPLSGVRVVKTAERDGMYHALAVLERQRAATEWRAELRNTDIAIEERIGELEALKAAGGGKLERLKVLGTVLRRWVGREVLLSRIEAVGDTGEPVVAGYNIKQVLWQLADLRDSVTVSVRIEGEHSGVLANMLGEAVIGSGLRLMGEGAAADVLISGTVVVSPVGLKSLDMEFARVRATLSVTDPASGEIVLMQTEEAKAGHVSYAEAVRRALGIVIPVLTEGVTDFLGGF